MAEKLERVPVLPTEIDSGPHKDYLVAMLQALTLFLTRMTFRVNGTLPKDGEEAMEGPLVLMTYTVATLPTASDWTGGVVYVSDGSSGQKFRGSDGSSWVNLG